MKSVTTFDPLHIQQFERVSLVSSRLADYMGGDVKYVITEDQWDDTFDAVSDTFVVDLGVNGKPICDFLLVIDCNFSRICYRF